jgi:hypothetical protein
MLCTQVEELVGTPVGEQMLSISSSGEQLDSHARLSDYPEIRNRSELLLSQLPTAAPVSVEEKRKRKAADSVLSMAKMYVPSGKRAWRVPQCLAGGERDNQGNGQIRNPAGHEGQVWCGGRVEPICRGWRQPHESG